MKISDLVIACAQMLGIDELITNRFPDEVVLRYSADDAKVLCKLSKSIYYAIERITEQYCPMKSDVVLKVTDGKIPYDSITTDRILSVTSIHDLAGNSLTYELYDKYVAVNFSGTVRLHYTYTISDKLKYGDEFYLPITITTRSIIYAACYEYCLMCGRLDEASIYDVKFKNSVMSGANNRKSRMIKYRRWI